MRILMLSGDRNILVPGTDAHARLMLQRTAVEKLDAFVWPAMHSAREVIRSAVAEHYDVVTVQDPFWRGILGWCAARASSATFNVQVHTDLGSQNVFRRLCAKIVLRHADSIRAVSERIKKQVEGMHIHTTVTVLPVFVDVSRFRAIEPHPHSQLTILWIGRFEDEKDPHLALQIFKEIRGMGIDAKLIMLGAGSLEHALRREAENLPVTFPGWQDTTTYLGEADVVLSTSRFESWGASIVEALAAGVPVVAPDVGIAKEAGAIVGLRHELSKTLAVALRTKPKGTLQLELLERGAWVNAWLKTFT